MDDNLYSLYPVRKWRIGELSTGLHSHEEILDLTQSFHHTECFLDAVGYVLKRVDVVFDIRPVSKEGLLSFLDPSPHRDEVALVTNKLEVVYLAWQLASDLNPVVASFQGDLLKTLQAEIRLVNRDAINAACDGSPLQKLEAAMHDRLGITTAFYRVNRELGILRARYELPGRVSGEKGHKQIPAEVAQDPPPPPFLGLVFNHDSTVSRLGDDYKDKRIPVEPQPLLLLKFVHDGGPDGRTQNAIISALSIDQNNLKSVKNRVNETLIPLGLSLGPRGQYAVTDKVT